MKGLDLTLITAGADALKWRDRVLLHSVLWPAQGNFLWHLPVERFSSIKNKGKRLAARAIASWRLQELCWVLVNWILAREV